MSLPSSAFCRKSKLSKGHIWLAIDNWSLTALIRNSFRGRTEFRKKNNDLGQAYSSLIIITSFFISIPSSLSCSFRNYAVNQHEKNVFALKYKKKKQPANIHRFYLCFFGTCVIMLKLRRKTVTCKDDKKLDSRRLIIGLWP